MNGEGLWWQRWVQRGCLLLRLVGWNSTLLAASEDQGKLRLGQRQLRETLGAGAAGEVVLVLSHHPLTGGWLADEREAGWLLRSRAHLHLTGHVHEAESVLVRDGGGQELVTLCAGAVHNEREHHQSMATAWPRCSRDPRTATPCGCGLGAGRSGGWHSRRTWITFRERTSAAGSSPRSMRCGRGRVGTRVPALVPYQ